MLIWFIGNRSVPEMLHIILQAVFSGQGFSIQAACRWGQASGSTFPPVVWAQGFRIGLADSSTRQAHLSPLGFFRVHCHSNSLLQFISLMPQFTVTWLLSLCLLVWVKVSLLRIRRLYIMCDFNYNDRAVTPFNIQASCLLLCQCWCHFCYLTWKT